MASVYGDILKAVEGTLKAMPLFLAGSSVAVARRKLPKAQEDLDTLPLIAVCPKPEPERIEQLGEALVLVTYAVEVVAIAPGNRDFFGKLEEYLEWREQIRQKFQGPTLAAVPAVRDMEMVPQVPLDRSLLNQNYDYSGLAIRVKAVEQRDGP